MGKRNGTDLQAPGVAPRTDQLLGDLRQMIEAAPLRVAECGQHRIDTALLAHRTKNPVETSLRRARRLRRSDYCRHCRNNWSPNMAGDSLHTA